MKSLISFRLLAQLGIISFLTTRLAAADYEPKPDDPYFAKFNPRLAPAPGPLLLHPGDRLAIVGDSITEQRMYSRIIETYLTICVPELKIATRQFGWSGETAAGFRKRMQQDCLRFQPAVATFCYGMNDARYRPYDDVNGEWYRDNYRAIVREFKSAGARVVLGSPGCAGKIATWVKSRAGTLDEHNLNLCTLRDIDIRLAEEEDVRFADVFWPMFKARFEGKRHYESSDQPYEFTGRDGIHPGWAGHLVMSYGFLRAMGLDGEIGTFSVDLAAGRATASDGHQVDSFNNGELTITSTRYPFCDAGATNDANSIRSGMTLVPFNEELNRLMLVVTNAEAANYQVTWGSASRTYTAGQLAAGVNLAEDFPLNPFSEPFRRVDDAVAEKQKYETYQIKKVFHGDEGRADIKAAVTRTEAERAPLVQAVADAFQPLQHTLRIAPVR